MHIKSWAKWSGREESCRLGMAVTRLGEQRAAGTVVPGGSSSFGADPGDPRVSSLCGWFACAEIAGAKPPILIQKHCVLNHYRSVDAL